MQSTQNLNDEVEQSLDLILAEFDQTLHELTRDISRISADNNRISELCGKVGGLYDSHDLRSRLNAVIEVNKDNIKKVSSTVQQLDHKLSGLPMEKKMRFKTLLREFQNVLERFQKLQQLAVSKSKEFVSQAQILVHSEPTSSEEAEELSPLVAKSQLSQSDRKLENEISYNQALIIEREQAIQEIQATMHEVTSIFKDLGALVSGQQYGFDNIAANIELASMRTGGAANEIRIAEDYRRRRPLVNCWYLMLAFLISFIIISFIISL